MPMVNEKFLRLLLVLVGVAALGAFGWRIYDYWRQKDALLQPVNISKLQEQAGGGPRQEPGHLLPYTEFAVIETLNVTGKEPERPVEVKPPPPPVARLTERDLLVQFIQFVADGHPDNVAYIQPSDEKPDENKDDTPGDFYRAGDRIPIQSKKDLKVHLTRVEAEKVVIGYGEGENAGELTLGISTYAIPDATLASLVGAREPGETAAEVRSVPAETRMNEAGDFEVGSNDVAYFEKLSQEEVIAAVPVKPDRDRLSNEIRGLRIQSVPENSPFARLGLRADDVVLEVNGQPALNRDDLLQALRQVNAKTVEVKLERLGAVRMLRYRLP
jgi:hypothetical protein